MSILTDKEVRAWLDLDDEYSSDKVASLMNEATSFVDSRTGHNWENDLPIDEEAKTCAKLYLEKIYGKKFSPTDNSNYDSAIAEFLNELKGKALVNGYTS